MLFRRNKTYQKVQPSLAKKSLLERLVSLDADGMDSPEKVAEKLEEDPHVEARVVRVRSFAPGRIMGSVPKERTIDIGGLETRKELEEEVIEESPRALHIERYEDAVSQIDEEKSEEEVLYEQIIENGKFENGISPRVPTEEGQKSQDKIFDILERAREQEKMSEDTTEAREQVRIIYRVPKRSYGEHATRNAIHNELIERINGSLEETTIKQPEMFEEIQSPEIVVTVQEQTPDVEDSFIEQNQREKFTLVDEIRSRAGNDVSDEHISEIIQGALAEAVHSGEIVQKHPEEQKIKDIERERMVMEIEDVRNLPTQDHFQKILFPEEYFYAQDGTVIKTVAQLHEALQNMHNDTYNHHAVSRGTNDFANWIEGVYGHEDCVRRMKAAGGREDLLTILGLYL